MWLEGCEFAPSSSLRPSLSRTLTCTHRSLGPYPIKQSDRCEGEIVVTYISLTAGSANRPSWPHRHIYVCHQVDVSTPYGGGSHPSTSSSAPRNDLNMVTCLGKCGRPRRSTSVAQHLRIRRVMELAVPPQSRRETFSAESSRKKMRHDKLYHCN